jgi:hypothetical protein
MQKSCGSKTLVHALALTGLGGTGKTQLVLRYIEQHKKRYDTILWLDVRDETTTTSSFKRCCGALSIALEQRPTDGLLHDEPAVQKLLKWLSAREQGQKWLVVLDNADELDQLPQIIPQNALAGSVIITSQDGKAAELLQRAKSTTIDKMGIDEGKALLAKAMKTDLTKASLDVSCLLEKLAFRLNNIALALDLAGARIRDDIDNSHNEDGSVAEGDVIDAIEQYLVDLEDHGRSMLSDPEHNVAKTYKKTIWNVWETVMSSLKRSEQHDPGSSGCTMHLLKLAVILGSTTVHHEIFRAASQSLIAVCSGLKTNVIVPPWFKALLQVKSTGVWDSYSYRKSVARLERFHLVRSASDDVFSTKKTVFETHPTFVSWPGYNIHGLLRWCTEIQMPQTEYFICREILAAACCRTWNMCDDGIDFRCALSNYMSPLNRPRDISFTQNGRADLCTTLGTTLVSIYDFCGAGRCLERAYELKSTLFGETAPEIIDTQVDVGGFYLMCALSQEDSAERKEGIEEANKVLGPILEDPKGEIKIAAASWDFMMLPAQLFEWYTQYREQCSGKSSTFAERAVQKKYDELSKTVIPEQIQALKRGAQLFGQQHRVVNTLRFNLAHIYGFFLKWDLSKKHLEDLKASEQQSLGRFDDRRMETMEMLAICQLRTKDPEAATEMMREVCKLSRTALGRHDPRTRLRERHLQRLQSGEWQAMLSSAYRDEGVDGS